MIVLQTKHISPSEPSLPSLALQVTTLIDSYMLWIGTTEYSVNDVERAPPLGTLCKDWACAMPGGTASTPAPATSLFRSSGSDIALSMATRLARRFQKQIFLSVDLPPTFLSMGQGPKLLLEIEKGIIETLNGLEVSSI